MSNTDNQQNTPFLTLADVKAWLRFPASAPVDTDPILNRFIGMACKQVEQYIHRPVAPTAYVERYDGWGGEYIMLHHTPVLSVSYCYEWQSSGGLIKLSESTPENSIDGYQLDYKTGRIMRCMAGYSWPKPWFPGSRNIEVSYTAGYNPIPDDLWVASCELVKHWWVNTMQVGQTTIKPGNLDYDPIDTGNGGLFPNMPYRISELLAPYRRVSIGGI